MLRTLFGQTLRFGSQIQRCQVSVLKENTTLCVFPGLNTQTTHSRNYSSNGNEYQVYKGPLASQMRLVKIFSLGSSIAGLAFQPIIFNHLQTAPGFAAVSGLSIVGDFFYSQICILYY